MVLCALNKIVQMKLVLNVIMHGIEKVLNILKSNRPKPKPAPCNNARSVCLCVCVSICGFIMEVSDCYLENRALCKVQSYNSAEPKGMQYRI